MTRALWYLAALLACPAQAADLTVRVEGAEAGTGQAMVAVFTGAETWMKASAAAATRPIGADGAAEASFTGLPAGPAGVSVIYDRNGNGELDTNLLGIPTEDFGFSNDAAASFGPARWEDARFDLPESGARIVINLTGAKQ